MTKKYLFLSNIAHPKELLFGHRSDGFKCSYPKPNQPANSFFPMKKANLPTKIYSRCSSIGVINSEGFQQPTGTFHAYNQHYNKISHFQSIKMSRKRNQQQTSKKTKRAILRPKLKATKDRNKRCWHLIKECLLLCNHKLKPTYRKYLPNQ